MSDNEIFALRQPCVRALCRVPARLSVGGYSLTQKTAARWLVYVLQTLRLEDVTLSSAGPLRTASQLNPRRCPGRRPIPDMSEPVQVASAQPDVSEIVSPTMQGRT